MREGNILLDSGMAPRSTKRSHFLIKLLFINCLSVPFRVRTRTSLLSTTDPSTVPVVRGPRAQYTHGKSRLS